MSTTPEAKQLVYQNTPLQALRWNLLLAFIALNIARVNMAFLVSVPVLFSAGITSADTAVFTSFNQQLQLKGESGSYQILEHGLSVIVSGKLIAEMELMDDFKPVISSKACTSEWLSDKIKNSSMKKSCCMKKP
ncbi:hypothetical protein SAMN02745866_03983 [Alteromonadaceae bacterium Bs31]|nr:hypothetical protein SAMN02745866_03983 [Alteromonadaceae bacterium Bs31]